MLHDGQPVRIAPFFIPGDIATTQDACQYAHITKGRGAGTVFPGSRGTHPLSTHNKTRSEGL